MKTLQLPLAVLAGTISILCTSYHIGFATVEPTSILDSGMPPIIMTQVELWGPSSFHADGIISCEDNGTSLGPWAVGWVELHNTKNDSITISDVDLKGKGWEEGQFPITLGPQEYCYIVTQNQLSTRIGVGGSLGNEPPPHDNATTTLSYSVQSFDKKMNYTYSTPPLNDDLGDAKTWQLVDGKWVFLDANFKQELFTKTTMLSPLKQFKSGIASNDVQCKQGLQLVIKAENGSPACVKPDTATKLVERGWATQMSGISFGGPTYVINDTDVSQVDTSVSALNLHMYTDSNVITPGQSIGISISVNNTLGTPIDITSQNNWSYPNVSTGPCSTIGYGVSILDGFYDVNNMTTGKILNLFNPGLLCPVVQETAKVYEFQSQSGNVKESQCKSIEGLQCRTDTYQMGQNYKFDGYWDAGTVKPFKSGVYTIIGADEWGHVVVEHFVVTNSTIFAGNLGHMSCPVMYGGGQFDATIKNSTGFAHYYNSEQYGNTFFLHPGTQGVIHVKYAAPANSSWFENNGNIPLNITNGAALFYMANATLGKSTISYAMSLYSDETGNHSQICHYGIQYGGGFAEPCNADNTGNIPPSELSVASKLLHPGVSTSFEPHSVMLYTGNSPEYTATISANSGAMTGIYWLSLERSLCGPGVLAKLVVMP